MRRGSKARDSIATLIKLAGRHSGFAGRFLKIGQLLVGGIQCLLLALDLSLFFAGVFVKLGGVAQSYARVGIEGGGAQLGFPLGNIQLPLQLENFALLRVDLLLVVLGALLVAVFFGVFVVLLIFIVLFCGAVFVRIRLRRLLRRVDRGHRIVIEYGFRGARLLFGAGLARL